MECKNVVHHFTNLIRLLHFQPLLVSISNCLILLLQVHLLLYLLIIGDLLLLLFALALLWFFLRAAAPVRLLLEHYVDGDLVVPVFEVAGYGDLDY